jgi:hypothetical protein
MATSYTKETKPTTPYTKEDLISYLLKQDDDFLLLESGYRIVLTRGFVRTTYTKETKP